jgi:hypothetical protein
MPRHTFETLTATLDARKEVLLHIEWDRPGASGFTIERSQHATCEDAWVTYRARVKMEARRRRREDRRHPYRAVYVGCTSTDKTYGGWLHNGGSIRSANEFLDDRTREWKRELTGLLYNGETLNPTAL